VVLKLDVEDALFGTRVPEDAIRAERPDGEQP
jgi:hypothetical protein